MDSDENSDIEWTPPEVIEAAQAISLKLKLLPRKSKKRYEYAYEQFLAWRRNKQIKSSFSENVLLAYMDELSGKVKPPTLWTQYSMLRSTIYANDNIDISKYLKLRALLKQLSDGYNPKMATVLTTQEVNEFLTRAPDEKFLFAKVALILGIAGACRKSELVQLTVDDIQDFNSTAIIKIENNKNKISRKFSISGLFYDIYKKYANMRPQTNQKRLFLNYQNGKCTQQVIGINKIGSVPKTVATFLKLDNPELYTGHCFRRSSASVLVDAGADMTTIKRHGSWKSSTVAEEYIYNSVTNRVIRPEQSTSIGGRFPPSDHSSDYSSGIIAVDPEKTTSKIKCVTHDKEDDFIPEVNSNSEIIAGIPFCRMCLRPANGERTVSLSDVDPNNRSEQFEIEQIEETRKVSLMIESLMPCFDFGLVQNPIMCHLCSTRLQLAFKFVAETMESQEKIRAYKKQHVEKDENIRSEIIINHCNNERSDFGSPKKKTKLTGRAESNGVHHQSTENINMDEDFKDPMITHIQPDQVEVKIERDVFELEGVGYEKDRVRDDMVMKREPSEDSFGSGEMKIEIVSDVSELEGFRYEDRVREYVVMKSEPVEDSGDTFGSMSNKNFKTFPNISNLTRTSEYHGGRQKITSTSYVSDHSEKS